MLHTISYRGKNLSYDVSGRGPVVVLLHGFGEDGRIWKNQVDFLSGSFCVIAPHLPGSGTSELTEDLSMEGLADAVHAILEKEQIKKCTLIGHSMGGYVTLAFAEKYPLLTDGFGLFHSTAFADTEEKKKSRREGIEKIRSGGAAAFIRNFIPQLYATGTPAAAIQQHIKDVTYFSEAALTAYYQSMMERPDRTAVLKQNKIPVLIVLGRKDAVIPFEAGLKLATIPDIAYIHSLENSGHMGMIEEPEMSNTIINTFLLKTV